MAAEKNKKLTDNIRETKERRLAERAGMETKAVSYSFL